MWWAQYGYSESCFLGIYLKQFKMNVRLHQGCVLAEQDIKPNTERERCLLWWGPEVTYLEVMMFFWPHLKWTSYTLKLFTVDCETAKIIKDKQEKLTPRPWFCHGKDFNTSTKSERWKSIFSYLCIHYKVIDKTFFNLCSQ